MPGWGEYRLMDESNAPRHNWLVAVKTTFSMQIRQDHCHFAALHDDALLPPVEMAAIEFFLLLVQFVVVAVVVVERWKHLRKCHEMRAETCLTCCSRVES